MIILLVILAIIAIGGTVATTAMRKGLDPQDSYEKRHRKVLGVVRICIVGICAQQYLEKWDGKLPQFMTDDGTGVMLNPDFGQVDGE